MRKLRGFTVLVLALLVATAAWGQAVAYSVRSDFDDQLYSINLNTGVATAIGAVGFADMECIAFHPTTGVLYGVDDATDQLITINRTTGAGAAVGALGVGFTDCGLSFDNHGSLFMSVDAPTNLYRINTTTGAATLVGSQGQQVTGLAFSNNTLYGLGGDGTNNLVSLNTTTGAATSIGPLGVVSLNDGGIDFDGSNVLWGLNDATPGQIFRIDTSTGAATLGPTISVGGAGAGGFESLAIFITPFHSVHGHTILHVHHGTHGHVAPNQNPPHAPGHTAGLAASNESALAPVLRVGVHTDKTLNGDPRLFSNVDGLQVRAARRGEVLQLFGSPNVIGMQIEGDAFDEGPPADGRLFRTTLVPHVEVGGVRAEVLFSGAAPDLRGVWQLNVRILADTPAGRVAVTVSYDGRPVSATDLIIE